MSLLRYAIMMMSLRNLYSLTSIYWIIKWVFVYYLPLRCISMILQYMRYKISIFWEVFSQCTWADNLLIQHSWTASYSSVLLFVGSIFKHSFGLYEVRNNSKNVNILSIFFQFHVIYSYLLESSQKLSQYQINPTSRKKQQITPKEHVWKYRFKTLHLQSIYL